MRPSSLTVPYQGTTYAGESVLQTGGYLPERGNHCRRRISTTLKNRNFNINVDLEGRKDSCNWSSDDTGSHDRC